MKSNHGGQELKTKIVKDEDEYIVKCWVNGVRYSNMDYFTDDKEEAEDTEVCMHRDFKIVKL